jgi:hypothetical protein
MGPKPPPSPTTHLWRHPNMFDSNIYLNLTVSLTRLLYTIPIALLLWATLLYGLSQARPASVTHVVILVLLLILLLAGSYFLLIILQLFFTSITFAQSLLQI